MLFRSMPSTRKLLITSPALPGGRGTPGSSDERRALTRGSNGSRWLTGAGRFAVVGGAAARGAFRFCAVFGGCFTCTLASGATQTSRSSAAINLADGFASRMVSPSPAYGLPGCLAGGPAAPFV